MQRAVEADGATKGFCFVTFASPDAVTRAIATMQYAEFQGKKITIARMDPARKEPCKFWTDSGWCKAGDRCNFSHNGPQGRGRGGFAGTVLARHCADARSARPPIVDERPMDDDETTRPRQRH